MCCKCNTPPKSPVAVIGDFLKTIMDGVANGLIIAAALHYLGVF